MARSILRKTLLAYPNDKPQLCPPHQSRGCIRFLMLHGGGAPEKMKEFLGYRERRLVMTECLIEKNKHIFPWCVDSVILSPLGSVPNPLPYSYHYHHPTYPISAFFLPI